MPTSPIAAAQPTQLEMASTLPARSQRMGDHRPRTAVRNRPSGRSRPLRIDPIHHLVADTNVVHPGKPGHPPSDRTDTAPHHPRNHSPPLDNDPASGKPIPGNGDGPVLESYGPRLSV